MSEKPKRLKIEYELTPEEAQMLSELVTACLEANISFSIGFEAAEDQGAGGFVVEVGGIPDADRSGWQTRFKTMGGAVRAGYRLLARITLLGDHS